MLARSPVVDTPLNEASTPTPVMHTEVLQGLGTGLVTTARALHVRAERVLPAYLALRLGHLRPRYQRRGATGRAPAPA
jgi:hypothetical protein